MRFFSWLKEKWSTRPAEFTQAFLGTVLGASRLIQGWAKGGFDLGVLTPELQGAILILVSFVSTLMTWLTAKAQREGQASSDLAGEVR